ncbi:hypothetical protein P4B35_03250 [Pontiellaceae bacterium B12227]|nr:hypothetical protein [Pontiellaceae bacterium B12227]
MEENNKVENAAEGQDVQSESGAIEEPVSKFACLGIAECQQVLERLKGGNIMDSLPYAVKELMDEFKHDKDTLKREVCERQEQLERHRQKAVDLQILKKYAPALEAYDEYFEVLGSQVGDYEGEKLRKECRQYVEQAKKRKWQMIAVAVVIVILCGVIVDQISFRQNVKAFQVALLDRDFEGATEAAIKISWRYDTEEGISNLVNFLEKKDAFNELCSAELTRASLDNYGGIKWQDVLQLVDQAEANEDLSQGINQLEQAVVTTQELLKDCVVLEEKERDYQSMYASYNHKDADHYAHVEWEQLEQLHATEITLSNLTVITERHALMVGITNQVTRSMNAQKNMQPIKDEFEEKLSKEKEEVQKATNYVSKELEKALQLREVALKKEEAFKFADARYLYIRAIGHVEASRKNRLEHGGKLAKMDQAKREFNILYEKLDIERAQTRCPDEWEALSDQKKKAESEHARQDRWNSDAEVSYKAAMGKLKNLMKIMQDGDKMYVSKEKFDLLYGKVDAGLAGKWFGDEWKALRAQKKKADAAYETEGSEQDDVRVYYEEASQMSEDLLVKLSDEARKKYGELCNMVDVIDGNLGKLGSSYPDDWKKLQVLIDKAEIEYKKPSYWESGAYKSYTAATKDLLVIYKRGKKEGKIVDFNDFKLEKWDAEMNAPSAEADNT